MTTGEWFFLLLVAGLATARVTRLITKDEITSPLRKLAHRLDPQARHIGAIVICPYCAGVWAAAGVLGLLAIAVHARGWGQWLAAAPVAIMAVSQAGFWLTPRDPDTLNETYMAPWPKVEEESE
jgi:Protein of unknown function (DUF1360)